jgi:hypothetical protein
MRIIYNIPDEIRYEYLEELLGETLCLSLKKGSGDGCVEVGCGQLHSIQEDTITLWHVGEAREFKLFDFDEVNVFYG